MPRKGKYKLSVDDPWPVPADDAGAPMLANDYETSASRAGNSGVGNSRQQHQQNGDGNDASKKDYYYSSMNKDGRDTAALSSHSLLHDTTHTDNAATSSSYSRPTGATHQPYIATAAPGLLGSGIAGDRVLNFGRETALVPRVDYVAMQAANMRPRDSWALCLVCFFIIGAGLLFPWNVVVTAVDYFNLVYPGSQIEFWFSVSYMSCDFVGLLVMLKWGNLLSFRARIIPGFIIFLAVTGAFYWVEDQYVSIGLMAILGLTEAVLTGSTFALAGYFPSRYTTACMSGVGAAGVIVSSLRNITKGSWGQNEDGIRKSARLYFIIAVAFLFLAILAYIYLDRHRMTRYWLTHDANVETHGPRGAPTVQGSLGYHDEIEGLNTVDRQRLRSFPYKEDGGVCQGDEVSVDQFQFPPDDEASYHVDNEHTWGASGGAIKANPAQGLYRQVWGLVWIPALSVLVTFWITLGLFPGLTSNMKSENESLNRNDWFPLLMITTFDWADLLGRTLPLWPSCVLWVRPRNIWIPALLRLAFIPLIILTIDPRVITKDYLQYIIMFTFAISNGYIGTLCMAFAPTMVAQEHKAAAGTLMIFCLTCGLTSGVWSGLGASKLLRLS